MAAPLAVVIPVSLTNQSYIQFPPSSYSFRWFRSVLGDPSWRAAAAHSLVASGVAVAIVFGVGMPAAFWIARSKLSARTRGAFMLAATIPVVLPLIVLALGVYIWYLEIHTVGSLLFLGIAQATLGLPFLVISVTVALRNFDVRLERASRSLGASGLTTMRLVTLPLIAAAVLSGLILAFFQAFDELLMALNVTNSTSMTLPVKMWIGATQELSPALATVSVLLLLATAVGFVCAVLPLRISQRRRARLGREV
jgi:ABC-type spermidine/putrescine transport system permease subunit II